MGCIEVGFADAVSCIIPHVTWTRARLANLTRATSGISIDDRLLSLGLQLGLVPSQPDPVSRFNWPHVPRILVDKFPGRLCDASQDSQPARDLNGAPDSPHPRGTCIDNVGSPSTAIFNHGQVLTEFILFLSTGARE